MGHEAPTRVRKIQPYPFAAEIEVEAKKIPLQVLKLTMSGLLANLGKAIVHVGFEYKVVFELPVSEKWVTAQAKVMKTYDGLKPLDDKTSKVMTVERMVELRFLNLTEEHRNSIHSFLKAIKQV